MNQYYDQGPDFEMSSFFPCEADDAIQYINLGYGAQAPKIDLRLVKKKKNSSLKK